MPEKITLLAGDAAFQAELNDSPLAERIRALLPATLSMSRWGEEYYGAIGLAGDNDPGATDVVEVGALAYWPPGDALCIFFGPTPVSRGDEPRAASAVTVVGRIVAPDPRALTGLPQRVRVSLDRA